MKKILSFFTFFILSFFSFITFAQDQEMMQKAMERFKDMKSLTADVVQTKHNSMVAKDITSNGEFFFKKPNKMCMTFNSGKDMMLMNGEEFTIVKDGVRNTAKGGGNEQLQALTTILKNFSAGQESDIDLSDIADVDVAKKGNLVVMTVTPIVSDPKAKRRQMFTSFVVTIDQKAGELKSLRMNEKGQNYTNYDFSNFKLNAPVNDSVFK